MVGRSASSGVSRLGGRGVLGWEAGAGASACVGESGERLSHEVFLGRRASRDYDLVTKVHEHQVLSRGLRRGDPVLLRSSCGLAVEKQWRSWT